MLIISRLSSLTPREIAGADQLSGERVEAARIPLAVPPLSDPVSAEIQLDTELRQCNPWPLGNAKFAGLEDQEGERRRIRRVSGVLAIFTTFNCSGNVQTPCPAQEKGGSYNLSAHRVLVHCEKCHAEA